MEADRAGAGRSGWRPWRIGSLRGRTSAVCGLLVFAVVCWSGPALAEGPDPAGGRVFKLSGAVKRVEPGGASLVIAHEALSGYMPAMTMPFKVRPPGGAEGVRAGDEISFRLHVNETESWIDRIQIQKRASGNEEDGSRSGAMPMPTPAPGKPHPLLDCPFTNELGQAVTLRSFKGQALAITFFFTRCPIPDFCPRLSKNFEEASHALAATRGGPTNWHFLSVSFDPAFDTPARLKAYGESYHYDARFWSFLTGPSASIRELARAADAQYESDGGLFNHNFRTLIIDAAGHLQMVFPTSGDLSDAIVAEMLKAAAVTHPSS